MMKRSLLTLAIAAATSPSLMAAPFLPMDARGLAMGNTGVASARLAHAPAYNPSLLSQARDNDDFAILFPQIGVTVADEKELINEAESISGDLIEDLEDSITELENALSAFQSTPSPTNLDGIKSSLSNVDGFINDLNGSLNNISGSPLSARLGLGGSVAIPNKSFAVGISTSGTANISGRLNYASDDSDFLEGYIPAIEEFIESAENLTPFAGNDYIDSTGNLTVDAENPNFDSTVQLVAVSVVDFAVSFSREFDIKGEKVAIGITPKLQKISTFHYGDEIDSFDEVDSDTVEDSRKDYSSFNLDIGASYRFGESDKWMVGVVGKNLLGGDYDYADVWVTPKNSDGIATGVPYRLKGGTVSLAPQFRAGVAYNGDWTSVAFDLDLVENDSVAFESATQYAAIGAEFDVFRSLQLRVGYRTNLSASDQNIVSAGIGISPFGLHIDIAAMVNPSDVEKEAGIALETGFYF